MTAAQPTGLAFLWLILPFPGVPPSLPSFCPRRHRCLAVKLPSASPAQVCPTSSSSTQHHGTVVFIPLDGPTTSLSCFKPFNNRPLLSNNVGVLTTAPTGFTSCLSSLLSTYVLDASSPQIKVPALPNASTPRLQALL